MYVFFDTETTGLPRNYNAAINDVANWPRVVQLAWLVSDASGEITSRNGCLIRPDGFVIPPESTRVHGITTEHAQKFGVDIAHALNSFLKDLETTKTLVAHNFQFDHSVLGAEFIRSGWSKDPMANAPGVCTMRGSTDYCRIPGHYGYKWPTLDELHNHLFGRGFEGAHDAVADVSACHRCFFELKRRRIISA